MAHYAFIENNIVTNVIVAEQEFIESLPNKEKWIKTSYNTRGGKHYDLDTNLEDNGVPLRYNYAGIGFLYDPILDAFIPPQPYPSWILNTKTCLWDSPISYPNDDKFYFWSEEVINWVESKNNFIENT